MFIINKIDNMLNYKSESDEVIRLKHKKIVLESMKNEEFMEIFKSTNFEYMAECMHKNNSDL